MDTRNWSPTTWKLLRECYHAERLRRIRRGEEKPTIERVIADALRGLRHGLTHDLRSAGYTWDDVEREIESYRRGGKRDGLPTADREQVIDDE